MNFAIVDDSRLDGAALEKYISEYFTSKQLHCEIIIFSSAEEFLASYCNGDFSAIFLDIIMDQTTGMDAAYKLRECNDQTPIIFVTSEDSYSLEGYSVQATDYLLKPINPARLSKTLDLLLKKSQPERYIEIKDRRMNRCLILNKLLYVRALGHYLEVHTTDETFSMYMALTVFTSLLMEAEHIHTLDRGSRFISSCRGYLVNLDHVQSLDTDSLRLKNGSLVPISRSRKKETQSAYADYLFAKTRGLL